MAQFSYLVPLAGQGPGYVVPFLLKEARGSRCHDIASESSNICGSGTKLPDSQQPDSQMITQCQTRPRIDISEELLPLRSEDAHLARTALEQASLSLHTHEACALVATCRGLHTFLESRPCEYWDDCQSGRYSQSTVWLHQVTSLKNVGQLVMLGRFLQLIGRMDFMRQSQIMSLTRVLQNEITGAAKGGDAFEAVTNRLLITWSFEPQSMIDLLGGHISEEVSSQEYVFRFRYGISFMTKLVISKASMGNPELTLRLSPVEMAGEYLSRIDIKVRCSVIYPDEDDSIMTLKPAIGGANVEPSKGPIEDVGTVVPDNSILSDLRTRGQLLSLVCVTVPRWIGAASWP